MSRDSLLIETLTRGKEIIQMCIGLKWPLAGLKNSPHNFKQGKQFGNMLCAVNICVVCVYSTYTTQYLKTYCSEVSLVEAITSCFHKL